MMLIDDVDVDVFFLKYLGYQFSQTMHEALKPEFNSIRPRIRAALFDSPVDWQGVPNGISHAVSPKSLVGRRFVQSSISALLFLAHPFITKHLIEASRRFTDEPLPVPTLVVTSGELAHSRSIAQ